MVVFIVIVITVIAISVIMTVVCRHSSIMLAIMAAVVRMLA